jgi:hypothetical protein
MLNMIKLAVISAFIASCSHNPVVDKPEPPKDVIKPISDEITTKLEIIEIQGFTEAQVNHIKNSMISCEVVINHDQFKIDFLHAKFNQYDNKGMTNTEIFNLLLGGSNNYDKAVDNSIGFRLMAYRTTLPTSKAVAYTTEATENIYLNTRVLLSRDQCSICGTFIHEYLHNLGFSHPVKSRWTDSVPYMVGDIASDVCNKLKRPL